MPIATHLIRRSSYYSWRRKAGGLVVQIALGTSSPVAARRLAVAMTAASERVWDDMINGKISKDDALAAMRASLMGQPAVFAEAQPSAVPEEIEAPHVDPSVQAIAARLTAVQLRTGAANKDTCEAIKKTAALIEEATGVRDIRQMRQHHVVALCDLLDRLPPSYRKSVNEREMTLEAIALKAMQEGREVGLSVGTMNRVLMNFSQIAKRADDEGVEVHPKLKPTAMRRKRTKKSRADRLSFTDEHIRKIFQAPMWQGCASNTRRHKPGSEIIRDAHYWIPLIAAYTGARREEIAGLHVADIQEHGGIWCFKFEENAERTVKTDASDRLVPIHPHLLKLGILEGRTGSGRFLNGLHRKSKKSKLGDCTHYNWSEVMKRQLPPEDLDRRCLHSFRHSMIDRLEKMDDVRDRTIKAIIGHTPDSITSKVYGSEATPEAMLRAIERLPRVF